MPIHLSHQRRCTTCALANFHSTTPATIVVVNEGGLQWFECGEHAPTDHPDGPWIRRMELTKWMQITMMRSLGFKDATDVVILRAKFEKTLQVLGSTDDE